MDVMSVAQALVPLHRLTTAFAFTIFGVLLLLAAIQFSMSSKGNRVSQLFRNTSLRGTLIVGLSLIGALPVFALGAFLTERSAHERITRVAQRMEERNANVSFSIDQFIDKHVAGINSAASAISASQQLDQESLTNSLLLYHRIYGDFLTMLFADKNGDIVTATSNMSGFLTEVADLQSHNVSDREYFRRPMRSGESFVSNVFQGRSLGSDPIVAVSAPVRNPDGDIIGIIEGSLNLNAFGRVHEQWSDMAGATVIVTDQSNRVVYSTDIGTLRVLENLSSHPLITAAADGRFGMAYSFLDNSGTTSEKYLGVARRASNGWIAYIRVPLDDIYAQISADYKSAAFLSLVTGIVSLILALTIVRRVSLSVKDMNAAIERMQLDQHSDEIRTPWNTFKEFKPLFRQLRDRHTDLGKTYRRLNRSIAAGDKLRSKLTQVIATKEAEIVERTAELEAANSRLKGLSSSDALTGIANRRQFDEALARRWTNEKFRNEPVSVILIDIDYFKLFNDSYGHQAGDACLQRVARALSECATRPQDLVARFGGEEFVAVLGDTGTDNALIVAARMRKVIESLAIAHPDSEHGLVTVSCGVATSIPANGPDAQSLLESADQALYAAKAAGRNQVNYERGGRHLTFEESSANLEATNVMNILKIKQT